MTTRTNACGKRLEHFVDGVGDEDRRIVDDCALRPGGKRAASRAIARSTSVAVCTALASGVR